MRYRALGNSGLVVSVAGLGCNNFGRRLDVAATRAVVDAAIDSGVTLLDTAESYGGAGRSEEILGEVLEGRWDQVVLATKFGGRGSDMGYGAAAGAKGGRSYIRRAVEESLRRLRIDHIDRFVFAKMLARRQIRTLGKHDEHLLIRIIRTLVHTDANTSSG